MALRPSGRLVLPEKLRSFAGIEKEEAVIGCADRAEIWDRTRWESFESENESSFDELDGVLTDPVMDLPYPGPGPDASNPARGGP